MAEFTQEDMEIVVKPARRVAARLGIALFASMHGRKPEGPERRSITYAWQQASDELCRFMKELA